VKHRSMVFPAASQHVGLDSLAEVLKQDLGEDDVISLVLGCCEDVDPSTPRVPLLPGSRHGP